jgi:hypothetical protein
MQQFQTVSPPKLYKKFRENILTLYVTKYYGVENLFREALCIVIRVKNTGIYIQDVHYIIRKSNLLRNVFIY